MVTRSCFALLLVAGAVAAAASECSRPYPLNLPREAPASQDAMLSLQAEVKAYLAEADAYLSCNEQEQRALAQSVKDGADADEVQVQVQILLTRYNNTVDEMHVVGDRYNDLVQSFKDRDGASRR